MMAEKRTKRELLQELKELRERVAELEKLELKSDNTGKNLQISEDKLLLKLDSLISPDEDIGEEELANIIDSQALQSLMDDFYAVTKMGIGILDLKGNVLVGTGWQDICTKFHRVNPETRKNCIQSDLVLSRGVKPGEFHAYKCRNNMWDIATPIIIGNKHVGNVFLGQFFYEDEVPDYELFAAQAEKYGFNKEEYLAALDDVPRWSREKVKRLMCFYARFAAQISQLGYSNLKLAKTIVEKERTEEALRKNQSELKSIIDGSPIPQFVIDQKHLVVHWNQALEEYSGIKAKDIIGTNHHWKAFYKNKRPCLADLVGSTTKEIEEWYPNKHRLSPLIKGAFEATQFFPDMLGGTWLYFTAAPIKDADGNRIGAVETLNDITGLKRVEKELKQSEAKYRSVIENIQDVFYRTDAHNNLIMASPSFIDMLGYSSLDKCLGKPIAETFYFNPEDRVKFLKKLRENGNVTDYEVLLKKKDGSSLMVETNSHFYYDDAGDFAGVEGIFRDITERKNAEKALKESEERFKTVANFTYDWEYWIDPDNNYVYVSPSCERITGYTPDDFLTDSNLLLEITHPDDREMIKNHLYHELRTEKDFSLEYRIINRQGFEIWIAHACNSVYNNDGLFLGRRASNRDITKRKQNETELIKYREQLEELVKERTRALREKTRELEDANIHLQELDRLKSMFIASMSHELRTPLNSIIGFTGIILMGMAGEISEEQRKQLTLVKFSAKHLLSLVNDVIDLSKVEAGIVELDIREFDLKKAVLDVCDSLKEAAHQKNLEISINMPETLMILSDERRVRQIIMNLLSNAIKFTDEGKIVVNIVKLNGIVEVIVKDTGIGIKEEDLSKLFKAFSQIYVEGRPKQEGTGLGLYLSNKIADILGGELRAVSEFGKGSEFIFSIPLIYKEK